MHPAHPIEHTQMPLEVAGGTGAPNDPLRVRTVEETGCVLAIIPTDNSNWFLPLRREEIRGNAAIFAMAPDLYKVAVELIYGGGSSESHQRAIDLARVALGIEKRGYQTPGAWPVSPFLAEARVSQSHNVE